MRDCTRYCTECGHEWRKRGKVPRWCSPECTPTCEVEGCVRKTQVRYVCRTHRTQGQDSPHCSISGCRNEVWARGWCGTHYRRWQAHGDPGVTSTRVVCSVEGCGRPHNCRGYCRTHYARWKAQGDPLWQPPAPLAGKQCRFDGCRRRVCKKSGKGYCRGHYRNLVGYGDPRGARLTCFKCSGEFFPGNANRRLCDECTGIHVRQGYRLSVDDLAKRDGYECRLCGKIVDFTHRWPDRQSPSVDHIIPWSLGGTHAESNLQLAHLACNMRKGNRVESPT